MDYTRKEANWDMKLAAVGLLAAWGVQETNALLVENKIKDLPTEYYHRAGILKYGLAGKPDYPEWV